MCPIISCRMRHRNARMGVEGVSASAILSHVAFSNVSMISIEALSFKDLRAKGRLEPEWRVFHLHGYLPFKMAKLWLSTNETSGSVNSLVEVNWVELHWTTAGEICTVDLQQAVLTALTFEGTERRKMQNGGRTLSLCVFIVFSCGTFTWLLHLLNYCNDVILYIYRKRFQ